MGPVMDRQTYDKFYNDWQEKSEHFARTDYPKSTMQAVAEMRSRGVDVELGVINHLLSKKAMKPPKMVGRAYQWTKDDIDRWAEYLARRGMLTPTSTFCLVCNVDRGQYELAFAQVKAENPDVFPDPTCFVMTIKPGAPEVGFPATVEFRRMTDDEEAERRKNVETLKRVRERTGASGPQILGDLVPIEDPKRIIAEAHEADQGEGE